MSSVKHYTTLKQFLDENQDRSVFEWRTNPKIDKRKNILLNRAKLLEILKDEYAIEPKYLADVNDIQLRYLMSLLDRNPRPHFAYPLFDENGNPPQDMGAKIVENTLLTLESNLRFFNQVRPKSSFRATPTIVPTTRIITMPPTRPISPPRSPPRITLPSTIRPVSPPRSPPRITLPSTIRPVSPPRITLPSTIRPVSPPRSLPRIALPSTIRPVSPPRSPPRIALPSTIRPVSPPRSLPRIALPSTIRPISPSRKSSIYLPQLEASPPKNESIRQQNILNEINFLKERVHQLELQL